MSQVGRISWAIVLIGRAGVQPRIEAAPRDHHRRAHRAWWMAGITMAALVAAGGFRSSTGALLVPLEEEFGWSRATTSGAVSLNLILYGLTLPSPRPSWGAPGCAAAWPP